MVSIKMTRRDSPEVSIAQYLSSPAVPHDLQNHCVPILDILPDPFEAKTMLMLMPYLRPFDDPPFTALGEVVDFVSQTLEVQYERSNASCLLTKSNVGRG